MWSQASHWLTLPHIPVGWGYVAWQRGFSASVTTCETEVSGSQERLVLKSWTKPNCTGSSGHRKTDLLMRSRHCQRGTRYLVPVEVPVSTHSYLRESYVSVEGSTKQSCRQSAFGWPILAPLEEGVRAISSSTQQVAWVATQRPLWRPCAGGWRRCPKRQVASRASNSTNCLCRWTCSVCRSHYTWDTGTPNRKASTFRS